MDDCSCCMFVDRSNLVGATNTERGTSPAGAAGACFCSEVRSGDAVPGLFEFVLRACDVSSEARRGGCAPRRGSVCGVRLPWRLLVVSLSKCVLRILYGYSIARCGMCAQSMRLIQSSMVTYVQHSNLWGDYKRGRTRSLSHENKLATAHRGEASPPWREPGGGQDSDQDRCTHVIVELHCRARRRSPSSCDRACLVDRETFKTSVSCQLTLFRD